MRLLLHFAFLMRDTLLTTILCCIDSTVIAFAVSYTWGASANQCNNKCSIGTSVPICNDANNQALVDKWRGMGKKVILSFGGAGMGGSWAGKTYGIILTLEIQISNKCSIQTLSL